MLGRGGGGALMTSDDSETLHTEKRFTTEAGDQSGDQHTIVSTRDCLNTRLS